MMVFVKRAITPGKGHLSGEQGTREQAGEAAGADRRAGCIVDGGLGHGRGQRVVRSAGVVKALDRAVGSIKARARGHSAGALPVGLATAGNHGDIPRSPFAPAPPCPKAVPLGSNGHTSRAGAFLEHRSPRGLGTATVLGGPGRVRGTDSVTFPNWAAAPPWHRLVLRLVTESGPGVG